MPRPGMSDGRVFTNYSSNCELNNNVKSGNSTNNVEYKKYIQNNAQKVMDQFTSSVPSPKTGCLPA